ncbi:hypothetical protein HK104_001660, partial [Borealophlyctis nickersoniae]
MEQQQPPPATPQPASPRKFPHPCLDPTAPPRTIAVGLDGSPRTFNALAFCKVHIRPGDRLVIIVVLPGWAQEREKIRKKYEQEEDGGSLKRRFSLQRQRNSNTPELQTRKPEEEEDGVEGLSPAHVSEILHHTFDDAVEDEEGFITLHDT